MSELILAKINEELTEIAYQYDHRDIPIVEEVPFNIEYHIGRYHALLDIMKEIDKRSHDVIYAKNQKLIDKMHEYIDEFIGRIK